MYGREDDTRLPPWPLLLLLGFAVAGLCWALSQTHWRDHYGHLHSIPRDRVPYWRASREVYWDEIKEGDLPGRSDYDR